MAASSSSAAAATTSASDGVVGGDENVPVDHLLELARLRYLYQFFTSDVQSTGAGVIAAKESRDAVLAQILQLIESKS